MTSIPWYKTTFRFGQTNLVELDPTRYDENWWREYWRKTSIQAVIVNAGGIVTYYPSKFKLHKRAETLGKSDLYGKVVDAAKSENLKVIARMDSNRVANDFYKAHPDWICVDKNGKPYMQADKFITCINSDYYWEYLPKIMEEIIERSSPAGFTDNSWAGLPSEKICYCKNCRSSFQKFAGLELPVEHDWTDASYQKWIEWSFECRTKIFDFNDRVTTQAGGKDCHWMGMIDGEILRNNRRFIDLRVILKRTAMVMLDHQRRTKLDGFEQNTEAGKRLHELAGWDKLIPESTPQYQLGSPAFRLSSMPFAEIRLWSSSGFAGGIMPWWHHIGSCHEDRRQYTTAEPIFNWHKKNEKFLVDRTPKADVGVIWSQENHIFLGRDKANSKTMDPYRGVIKALDREGISYLPIHVDDIEKACGQISLIILPNIGVMHDSQIRSVRKFIAQGGSVIATSETSLYSELGVPRLDFGLADDFGVYISKTSYGDINHPDDNLETHSRHSYLRLHPELRLEVFGPEDPTAPEITDERHPIFEGLENTDTLPFGGYIPIVSVKDQTKVISTFIKDFPIFPPETSWMREPYSDIPAIVARETTSGSKLIWFVADIDRCHAREEQFEHALLIGNAVRWALENQLDVTVSGGRGFISPSLYEQKNRYILHLNNRVITTRVPGRQNNLVPIGPVGIKLKLPPSVVVPETVELCVAEISVKTKKVGNELTFSIPQVEDHEVVIVTF